MQRLPPLPAFPTSAPVPSRPETAPAPHRAVLRPKGLLYLWCPCGETARLSAVAKLVGVIDAQWGDVGPWLWREDARRINGAAS
jgi:hypothetical protein